MENTAQSTPQVAEYKGVDIFINEYGWFNVPLINCWSTPSVDSAKRAIDRQPWAWGKAYAS